MLYSILKPTVTAALRLYFRRISRSKLDVIDNGKPTLILANHTASFMDAILVACFVRRRIHFFARGDVFGKKWADKILRSIGLLPVYRLSEGRDKLHLNDDSNDSALEILSKGGAVLIFCEGASDIAKRLKPLKKGPFRLAATAAATLPEPPLIVPLGINYITPTTPGGDVFLMAGDAMPTFTFLTGTDEPARAKAATDMMRETGAALFPLSWHTTHLEREPLADQLLLSLQNNRGEYSFQDTQTLLNRLNTATDEEASNLTFGTGSFPDSPKPAANASLTPVNILLLILLSPLALAGWLFHTPAISLAKSITDKKVESPDFYAPVFLSMAIPLILLTYVVFLILAISINPTWLWLPTTLLMAASGIIYLKVYRPLLRKSRTH